MRHDHLMELRRRAILGPVQAFPCPVDVGDHGPGLPAAADILRVPRYCGPFVTADGVPVWSISPRSRFYTKGLR